ncbi:MAG: DUF4177 domain-containing protein [Pseudomonadota bacterium]
MTQKLEYKVIIYREGLFGSIFLGESKVDPVRYTAFLNQHAAEGWRVVTVERETRRALLFFSQEAFLTVLERPAQG